MIPAPVSLTPGDRHDRPCRGRTARFRPGVPMRPAGARRLVWDLGVLDPPADQMPPFPSVDRASTRARAQRTEVRFCLGQVRLIATVSKVHSQEFLKSTQLPAIFAFPRTNGA